MRYLPRLLRRAVRKGRLTVNGPQGERHEFGDGDGPDVVIRITDPSFDWKIFLNPELRGAEAYMDGVLVIEKGDVYDLLSLFFLNKREFDTAPHQKLLRRALGWGQRQIIHNSVARSLRNARSHYDIGNDLYRRMLDPDMQYSCGYWPEGVETLEEAQTAKKRHIAAKLALEPGQRVLDIGCGWGGMALYLASVAEVEVVGVTLAEEQLKVARDRADAMGLSDRVRFELRDYRDVEQRFDRVVSVGMLEHVGVPGLPTYFAKLKELLEPRGVALIHSIISMAPPGITSPFIRKYVFPGGYSPAVSEVARAIEKPRLWMLDGEIWRVHYARTLRAWRENFDAARDELAPRYDARFKRMWELYLASCEALFRHGVGAVMQLQIGRERDVVPSTRDYMGEAERRLAALEGEILPRLFASTATAFSEAAPGGPRATESASAA